MEELEDNFAAGMCTRSGTSWLFYSLSILTSYRMMTRWLKMNKPFFGALEYDSNVEAKHIKPWTLLRQINFIIRNGLKSVKRCCMHYAIHWCNKIATLSSWRMPYSPIHTCTRSMHILFVIHAQNLYSTIWTIYKTYPCLMVIQAIKASHVYVRIFTTYNL